MAEFLSVSGCEIQDKGDKRIYHLNNDAVVIEHPKYPGKTRFQFYTKSGQSIRKPADKTAMKQAVERHKKRWRLA
ncbi:TPA: hypothetical protein MHQ07_03350 [Klebsiella pneumoniae subsp. pneumoniae]|uniref:hypothetical protein n=1 Tax=Klebsiella/Raoultella group TaxID=2890311 RepID=UPI0002500B19|nr:MULTISPECIES: hypothetical protein [Klebsiella/Raoultella group]HBX1747885.1 hypothetical protein [Klebsiella pneumoniae subsp. pneumoniae]EHT03185.1 hypothetical protein HMPREF9690_05295 [Raoultella ornithinolytica 10-5246]EKW9769559.1 hypothetical protein [Klebsiella pneumoniae]EKZ5977225.1 hypothetical protein [Klebsiella pneumoniae]MBD7803867.1 hypothetical protein [Klebsiella pneumoniae]